MFDVWMLGQELFKVEKTSNRNTHATPACYLSLFLSPNSPSRWDPNLPPWLCSLLLSPTLLTPTLISFISHIFSTGEWRLSCRTNPLVIPVSHDLSVAFYHTKAILVMFASRLVAISGVGLRSFQSFDPITISGCQSNEIYNPTGQRWGWETGKGNGGLVNMRPTYVTHTTEPKTCTQNPKIMWMHTHTQLAQSFALKLQGNWIGFNFFQRQIMQLIITIICSYTSHGSC